MENSFSSIVDSASSILILLPTKPNFDQAAAGLALYLSLRNNKEISIFCPTPMVVELNRLVGINKISSESGNKNLVIKFDNYPAENIERVSADVENREFNLKVIPKSGFSSPKKEQVILSYSGVSADLVIIIGGANESDFPILSSGKLTGVQLVHVGIKAFDISPEKSLISFAHPASSISEAAAVLIRENNLFLDEDVATDLVLGIEEGSDHFAGEDVTSDTFILFAGLLKAGGQRIPKTRFQRGSYPPGSIPGEEYRIDKVEKKEEGKEKEGEEITPKDWFEPKIYKGTSVS